jgi:hypothetical protein
VPAVEGDRINRDGFGRQGDGDGIASDIADFSAHRLALHDPADLRLGPLGQRLMTEDLEIDEASHQEHQATDHQRGENRDALGGLVLRFHGAV